MNSELSAGVELPTALVAMTLILYVVPKLIPIMEQVKVPAGTEQVAPVAVVKLAPVIAVAV